MSRRPALAALLRGRLLRRRGLARGFLRRFAGGLLRGRARLLGRLARGFFCRLLLCLTGRKIFVEALHLVLIRVVVEHNAQFLLVEGGHAFALARNTLRKQVDDLLARYAEVLCDLVQPVLFDHSLNSSSDHSRLPAAVTFANHRRRRGVGTLDSLYKDHIG